MPYTELNPSNAHHVPTPEPSVRHDDSVREDALVRQSESQHMKVRNESAALTQQQTFVNGDIIHPAKPSLSNADLRAHYDDLRGQMDALIDENDMLRRGRSSEVYAYSLKISEMQSANQSLSSQIETLVVTTEQLESEKKLLMDENANLLQENERSAAMIKNLEARCSSLDEQKRALERTVSDQQNDIKSLQQEKVPTTLSLSR
jgi:chromosome segregation ATPase